MVQGENRRKIVAEVADAADTVGDGIKKVTLGVGKGLKDLVRVPETPTALESCLDRTVSVKRTRTVDFVDPEGAASPGATAPATTTTLDAALSERVKGAKEGARHLKVVFARPLPDASASASAPSTAGAARPKSPEDTALIAAALGENAVFAHLDAPARVRLVAAFEATSVAAGARIVVEGDAGDYFYVVAEGTVEFVVGGRVAGTAGRGGSFGELALLYDAPRAATCVARTPCGLFRLGQEAFRKTLAQQIQESRAEILSVLKKVSYFKDLDDAILNQIANNLQRITYQDGDVVVSREMGTPKRFIIVTEGVVEITGLQLGGQDYKNMCFKAGSFFGGRAIVEDQWAEGTASARGETVVLALDREQFVRAVGGDMDALIRRTTDKRKLALIPYGKGKRPQKNELDLLVGAIKEKRYPRGTIFFQEGKYYTPALYLIREGEVSLRSFGHANFEALLGLEVGVKTVGRDGYFGNDTLGENERGELGLAQYTAEALSDITAGVLDLDAIREVSGFWAFSAREHKIRMEDVDMVRILGAGTFGRVWLVSRRGTKEAYALKVQVKKQLIEYNQADGVIREKNIMAKLNHPFVIKLVSHWKDEYKLYMLLKLYQGGELETVIHTDTRDGIPEWAARFYAANILEGLSFMHRRHIVYRDLKPENVLLDSKGYAVIVDLGFAKIVADKTYTFCGTPLYLAPEIITQRGYDKGADHWSWGVMLYEMIVGMTPFYTGTEDEMELFQNIVERRMQEFPPGEFMSLDSKDLILRMLRVNPSKRLGSFAGADKDIREHPFFEVIDWKKLANRNVRVPFKPNVSDPLDGSNFDDYSKLEAKVKKEKHQNLTVAEDKLFDRF